MSPWWLLLVLALIWLVAVLVVRCRERGPHRAGATLARRRRYHGESSGRRLRDWWAWRQARRRR